MVKGVINNWVVLSIMLCFLFFLSSCGGNESKPQSSNSSSDEFISQSKEVSKGTSDSTSNVLIEGDSLLKHPLGEPNPNYKPYYHLSKEGLGTSIYYRDTVTVRTEQELVKQIRSNRLIRLVDKEYILNSSLRIDGIKNLKIVGMGSSKLFVYERNQTVLRLLNSHNIHLDGLIIGDKESSRHGGEPGVLNISYSYNINIANCKLNGSGTFGLVTYAVYNLEFTNSEITECSTLIFDLERSRKFQFKNSKFHNNNLSTSVLGGFSNASKDISFLNCVFSDNEPSMAGNPAFNQRDLYAPILFSDCTFKNNKGFKWYGDNLKLNNCNVDSSGFIGFQ